MGRAGEHKRPYDVCVPVYELRTRQGVTMWHRITEHRGGFSFLVPQDRSRHHKAAWALHAVEESRVATAFVRAGA